MNPEIPQSPREELEAQLTALLLGELNAGDAARLHQAMEEDADLRALYERLKATVELVSESSRNPVEQSEPQSAPVRLSSERREQLLARFRTVELAKFASASEPRRKVSWLIPISAAAAIVVLGGLAIPGFISYRSNSQLKGIANELRQLEAAKEQWALAYKKSGEDIPTLSELRPYFGRGENGELMLPDDRYVPGKVSEPVGVKLDERMARLESDYLKLNEDAPEPNPSLRSLNLRSERVPSRPTRTLQPSSPSVAVANNSDIDEARPGIYSAQIAGYVNTKRESDSNLNGTLISTNWTLAGKYGLDDGFLHLGGDGFEDFRISGLGADANTRVPNLGDRPTVGRLFREANQPVSHQNWYFYDGTSMGPNGSTRVPSLSLSGGNTLTVTELDHSVLEESGRGLTVNGTVSPLDANTNALARRESALMGGAGAFRYEINGPAEPRQPWPVRPASASEIARVEISTANGRENLERFGTNQISIRESDPPATTKPIVPPTPQPEVSTRENRYSTFSLNVSDVSFQLAAASLQQGVMPNAASIRSEEFLNAFDYRDPEPAPGSPIAFASERARYPFAHNRDLLRFSIKTAAAGREAGRPLNLILLLDNSGSMERADRIRIIRHALSVLAAQLQPQDRLSIITFARTATLRADGVTGDQASNAVMRVIGITPEGGTNLEGALDLAYRTALRHYAADGVNRVVLLTDGAANLGEVDPDALRRSVESHRRQGIALDCFGIGWDGYNDDLLEALSRNGDGRYGFINTPEEAASGFVRQLTGALQVAASDVKVQVEFNPARVNAYRQIGYARHQLTKQQFRDNTVDAAEIGAAESGNGLYVVDVNPAGQGPIATVRVRYRVPGTADYREREWVVPYSGPALPLEQASPAMRLAATSSAFSEWLAESPHAAEVTTDRLLQVLNGVPETFGADERPARLEWMIRQARSIGGR